MKKRKLIFDIEASGLLDHTTIDYSRMPYTLKPDFKIHCIVFRDMDSNEFICFYDGPIIPLDGRRYSCPAYYQSGVKKGERKPQDQVIENYAPIKYTHYQKSQLVSWVEENASLLAGHNILDYDLLALFLYYRDRKEKFDYTIELDTLNGKKIYFHDTLVLSRLLDPDVFGGHSLENLAQKAGGSNKFQYEGGFDNFNPIMLYYCLKDTLANHYVYLYLKDKTLGWNWGPAYSTEKSIANYIARQKHYGFWFDKELGKWCADDLNKKIAEIEKRVEPLLPPRPISKGTAKEYTPPKAQFKQNGEASTHFQNFLEKHGGKVIEAETIEVGARKKKEIIRPKVVEIYGKQYDLPLEEGKPIKDTEPMLLANQEDIKKYLIKMGWEPTNWKDNDLTIDAKKQKLSRQKFIETVERYLESTLGTPLEKFRCEHLKTTPSELRYKLLNHDMSRPLKVLTLPSYSINLEKDLCPNLIKLGEKVEFVADIVKWLTYRHRRNCILSPNDTGWLVNPRLEIDGRIPTPANPCGCNTSRMQHKDVANVPRATSMYGEYMRSLFGAGPDGLQVGYDADGLEGRIEGHYCYDFTRGPEYAKRLVAEKPNDDHTVRSKNLGISRDEAKTLKYSCSYGAQPPKIAKQMGWPLEKAREIFEVYWEDALPLKLFKEAVEKEWESNFKTFVIGIDGRKLMTRSKHSLVNVKFQSAGVICMKVAMIWLHKQLQQRGLLGDPFKEDISKRPCTLQMIAYHDESQNRIDRRLVEDFKTFPTEEEAKEYKSQRELYTKRKYSDIGHRDNYYYVGYCIVGDLATQSITKAGELLGLNVPLSAGYSIGKNWRDTH